MPVARAIANGNWSSASTWFGGVLPGNGDTVYAGGFTVSIDQAVNIGGANNSSVTAGSFIVGCRYVITAVGTTNFTAIGASSNTVGVIFTATGVGTGNGTATTQACLTTASLASPAIAAGGGFTLSANNNIAADLVSGTSVPLTISGAANATITGNAIPLLAVNAINNSSTGTINFVGNLYYSTGTAFAINHTSVSGTLNVTGTVGVTHPSGSAGFQTNALQVTSTGVVSVTGNLFGQIGNTGNAINATAASTITVNGSIYGGNSTTSVGINSTSSAAITCNSTVCQGGSSANANGINMSFNTVGQLNFTGSIYGGSGANGIFSSSISGNIRINGSTFDNSNGFTALCCVRYILNTPLTGGVRRVALNGSSTFQDFFTADSVSTASFTMPAASDVRSGVTYAGTGSAGGSVLTGTAAIPAAASVAFGVPVDSTTGTAVLTPAAVQAAILPLL